MFEGALRWYQTRISLYDKQSWETTVEQRILQGLSYTHRKSSKIKDLIDVDLVRGSTFPKNKPEHGIWIASLKGILRAAFLPFYLSWWHTELTKPIFVLLIVVYISILSSCILIFTLDVDSDLKDLPISEVLIPAGVFLLLSVIYSQIVCTRRGSMSSSFSKEGVKPVNSKRRMKLPRRNSASIFTRGKFGMNRLTSQKPDEISWTGHIGNWQLSSEKCCELPNLLIPDIIKTSASPLKCRHKNEKISSSCGNNVCRRRCNTTLVTPLCANTGSSLEANCQSPVVFRSTSCIDVNHAISKRNQLEDAINSVDDGTTYFSLKRNEALAVPLLKQIGSECLDNNEITNEVFTDAQDSRINNLQDANLANCDSAPKTSLASLEVPWPHFCSRESDDGSDMVSNTSSVSRHSGQYPPPEVDIGPATRNHLETLTEAKQLRPKLCSCGESSRSPIVTNNTRSRLKYRCSQSSCESDPEHCPFPFDKHYNSEWASVTTNSEDLSYGGSESDPESDEKLSLHEPSLKHFHHVHSENVDWHIQGSPAAVITSTVDCCDKVGCKIWVGSDIYRVHLSVLDISSAVFSKVDSLTYTSHYLRFGMSMAVIIAFVPSLFRLDSEYLTSIFDRIVSSNLTECCWEIVIDGHVSLNGWFSWTSILIALSFLNRLCVAASFFFLLSVAEHTFKQRSLYAKHFCYLTSARRSRKYDLPFFRLNKVMNIKAWLSVRSCLKKRGPQHSMDVIVSTSFVVSLVLVSYLCFELLREDDHTQQTLYNWEMFFWCFTIAIYLIRFMTLGSVINKKYSNPPVLITEQINMYLHMEHEPHKKDGLILANNVLKLVSVLLKELDSPFKISGLSANPVLYNITKLVVLSACSGVLSEMLGFKLKLHRIKF